MAQQSALAPAAEDYKISANVDRVLLDVSVKDRNGKFVSGLTKDAFKIYEGTAEQPIKLFATGEEPVSVGLVVDNSGSMRDKRQEVVLSALSLIRQAKNVDDFFVVNFSSRPYFGLPQDVAFSSDVNQLRAALMSRAPEGRTALYDAIGRALDHLAQSLHQRKALVIVSDGADNSSYLDQDSILARARSSSAIFYTIGIYSEDEKDKNPRVLRRFANETGGEFFRPDKLPEIGKVMNEIAADLRSRYLIGFIPNATAGAAYRKLKVTAESDTQRYNVRTRAGYTIPGVKP